MEQDAVGQIGEYAGTIAGVLIILQLLHWLVRKIRRRPKKTFREWLASWWVGPEFIVFGICLGFLGALQHVSGGVAAVLESPQNVIGTLLIYAGVILLAGKVVLSLWRKLFGRHAPLAQTQQQVATPSSVAASADEPETI